MDNVDLGGSWLHRVFIARQRLEAELDLVFEDAPWPSAMKIVLYNEVDAGLGDVAFMTKLCHLLAAGAQGPELVLVTTGIEKQAKFLLPPEVVVVPAGEAPGHPALHGCDLIVSAPGIFDHCRAGASVREALGLPPETPFIYLAEYGSIRQLRVDAFRGRAEDIDAALEGYLDEVAAAAGVDAEHIGFRGQSGEIVAVDEGAPRVVGRLDGFFLDERRADNPIRDLVGAELLTARSCGLERGEIGVHVDRSLVAQAQLIAEDPAHRLAVAATIEHPQVRALVLACLETKGQLYQGYAHSGHAVYHDIVSVVARKDAGDVLVVSPDRRAPATVFANDFPPALQERIAARGFGAIVVTGRVKEQAIGEVTFEERWGAGPAYRVVTTFPLPHEDMKRLMLVSEAPTMVSGDQSFSDAISAMKSVAVIEPVYCQTWHLDAVCALAGTIDSGVEAVLRAGLQYEWSPAHLDPVRAILESKTVWDGFATLTRTIAEEGSANHAIVRLVKRALWTLVPRLAPATREWIRPAIASGLKELRGEKTAVICHTTADSSPPWRSSSLVDASDGCG